MSLADALDAVDRYRERVRAQAQLARDIQHLQEVARMLFEDKPDKTKAVEAVNDIAAKRLARMDEGARQLLDSEPPIKNRNGSHDRGELIRWLMLVNRPGQFPYTQGIAEPGAPKGDAPPRSVTSAGDARCASRRIDGIRPRVVPGGRAEGWLGAS